MTDIRIFDWITIAVVCLLVVFYAATSAGQNGLWSAGYIWNFKDQTNRGSSAIVELPPIPDSHTYARTWVGRALLDEGDPERAAQAISKDVLAGDIDALRLQGEIFAAESNLDAALEIWQQTGDVHLIVALGSELRQAGRLTDAMRAFQAAYDINQEEGALRLASFLWEQLGDSGRAEQILSTAVNTHLKSPYRSSWLTELGDLYRDAERWDAAQIAYTASLDIDPRNPQTYVNRGWLFYDAGSNLDRAIESFEQAIEINETFAQGHFAMARILFLSERYGEAKPWFDKAIDLDGRSAWWHQNRIANIRINGNLAEATALAQAMIVDFPDFAAGHLELARLELQNNNLGPAQQAIERAILLAQPDAPQQYLQLAQTIADKSDALR